MIIVNFHVFSKVRNPKNATKWESSSQLTVSKLIDECVIECDSPREFADERVSDSDSDFSVEAIKTEKVETPCHSSNTVHLR